MKGSNAYGFLQRGQFCLVSGDKYVFAEAKNSGCNRRGNRVFVFTAMNRKREVCVFFNPNAIAVKTKQTAREQNTKWLNEAVSATLLN